MDWEPGVPEAYVGLVEQRVGELCATSMYHTACHAAAVFPQVFGVIEFVPDDGFEVCALFRFHRQWFVWIHTGWVL